MPVVIPLPADRLTGAMEDEGRAATRIPHIPRLDGLRGIAIALVVVFHTGLGVLPGGYLGIDLFFVLSGYLITTLLLVEHHRRGGIDLPGFWGRRFRRLVPALLVVLAAILVFARVVDDQPMLHGLRGDGLSTLFYVANWHFVLTGQSYFQSFALSPLRHTWSLAVEEQWYLVWPPLLWLLLKVLRSRRQLLAIIVALAAVSAGWMAWLSGGDLSRAYYGTDARAQTLLVGAGLAVFLFRRPVPSARRLFQLRALGLAGATGFAAIVVLGREQADWMYRGGFLLVALLGATVVASSVLVESGPLSWLLQFPPLRYLGIVSYALYLWHWPIDVLLDSRRLGLSGWPLAGVQTAIALAIASISTYLFEMPIRRGWPRFRTRWRLTSAVGSVTAVALALGIFAVGSLPLPIPKTGGGIEVARPSPRQGDLDLLVVGDSVAWALTRDVPADLRVHTSVVWHSQCDIIGDTVYVGDTTNQAEPGCSQWPAQWRLGATTRPDAIVVVLGLRQLFDPLVDDRRLEVGSPRWRSYYGQRVQLAIDTLRSESAAPIVFFDVPCYTWAAAGTDTAARDPGRRADVNDELRAVAARNPGVEVVDYASLVCDGPQGQDNIESLRPDGAHPTAEGSARIWSWLVPRIRTYLGSRRDPAPATTSPSGGAGTKPTGASARGG